MIDLEKIEVGQVVQLVSGSPFMTVRGFACVMTRPRPSPAKSMTTKPRPTRMVRTIGKASGPQSVGESGERDEVEVFSTDVRIDG